jgi:hypothetical protein
MGIHFRTAARGTKRLYTASHCLEPKVVEGMGDVRESVGSEAQQDVKRETKEE